MPSTLLKLPTSLRVHEIYQYLYGSSNELANLRLVSKSLQHDVELFMKDKLREISKLLYTDKLDFIIASNKLAYARKYTILKPISWSWNTLHQLYLQAKRSQDTELQILKGYLAKQDVLAIGKDVLAREQLLNEVNTNLADQQLADEQNYAHIDESVRNVKRRIDDITRLTVQSIIRLGRTKAITETLDITDGNLMHIAQNILPLSFAEITKLNLVNNNLQIVPEIVTTVASNLQITDNPLITLPNNCRASLAIKAPDKMKHLPISRDLHRTLVISGNDNLAADIEQQAAAKIICWYRNKRSKGNKTNITYNRNQQDCTANLHKEMRSLISLMQNHKESCIDIGECGLCKKVNIDDYKEKFKKATSDQQRESYILQLNNTIALNQCCQGPLQEIRYITRMTEQLITCLKEQQATNLLIEQADLHTIPANISELKQLQNFTIYGSNLQKLPEELCSLPNLQHIDFSYNKLTELPINFSKMTNLRIIALKNNNLTELPEDISKFTNLRVLDVRNNKLSKLPAALTNLPLKYLKITGNLIYDVPTIPTLQHKISANKQLNLPICHAFGLTPKCTWQDTLKNSVKRLFSCKS